VMLRNVEGATRTIPLAQFTAEVEGRPLPTRPEDELLDEAPEEISPELMYTSEFAVPEPRLVILTETIETPAPATPASDDKSRGRRRRGRRGGRRAEDREAGSSDGGEPG